MQENNTKTCVPARVNEALVALLNVKNEGRYDVITSLVVIMSLLKLEIPMFKPKCKTLRKL